MAYIEKRVHPDGKTTYRARIRIHGMPEQSATFFTRTAAKDWALKKENELRNSRYFPRDCSKNKTFADFVDHYIHKFLPKNLKSYSKQKQLMLFWKSQLGKYYLFHITPSLIAESRDQLLEQTTRLNKKRSPSTVNRYLSSLSRAFTICVKELGWLKENPCQLISRPSENKGREIFLDKEEIQNLLFHCKQSKSPFLYTIVLFALATGARRGEIMHLKWADVDLIYGIAIFRNTKNGESRSVALSPLLLDCIKDLRRKRAILSPFVFPSYNGTKPADIETAWDRAIKKADLNIRFHDLRHTAASHLAMSGASTLEIAAVLGHKTLAMVKRYSHLSTSATAKALNKMNEAIFGGI